jgi:hypothetical protein
VVYFPLASPPVTYTRSSSPIHSFVFWGSASCCAYFSKVIRRTVPHNNCRCLFHILYTFAAKCFCPCWPYSGEIHNHFKKLLPLWTKYLLLGFASSVFLGSDFLRTVDQIFLSSASVQSQSQSHITTDSQSASPSWCQASIWDPRPIFSLRFSLDSCGLLFCSALYDERAGL